MGPTRYLETEHIGHKKRTRGTETSQYPEERKSTETPRVVASERGSSPNHVRVSGYALRTRGCRAPAQGVAALARVTKS